MNLQLENGMGYYENQIVFLIQVKFKLELK